MLVTVQVGRVFNNIRIPNKKQTKQQGRCKKMRFIRKKIYKKRFISASNLIKFNS